MVLFSNDSLFQFVNIGVTLGRVLHVGPCFANVFPLPKSLPAFAQKANAVTQQLNKSGFYAQQPYF